MEASEQSGTLTHVGVIDRNFDVLERCTDVNVYVITCLRAEGVLDDRQASSIKAERCLLLRSVLLYNLLKESKDVFKYEKFLRVMERTDVRQEHVANLLRGNTQGDLMPISGKRYTRLVQIKPKFTNAASGLFIGVDFLTRLISSEAISDTDYQDIDIQKANYKRCDALMTAIMRRSNRALDLFRQALIETKQEHFATFLDEGEAPVIHLNTSRPELDGQLSEDFNTAIAQDPAQMSQLNEIGLHPIAVREGNSIEVFIYCRKINNMETFIEAFNSSKLQNILTSILNRLLLTIEPDNTDGIRTKISIDEEEVFALEKATGIEDWIKDESKIRRHNSKSVRNVDVQCDLEDSKQSTHGDAQLAPEVPEAYNRLKRSSSATEMYSPPKRHLSSVKIEEPEIMETHEKSVKRHADSDLVFEACDIFHWNPPVMEIDPSIWDVGFDFTSGKKLTPDMETFGKSLGQLSGSHQVIPSSMESLSSYKRRQGSGDEGKYLERKRSNRKASEKYRAMFKKRSLLIHDDVKFLKQILPSAGLKSNFKPALGKDTPTSLHQAVTEYLKMGSGYDKLSTIIIEALLESEKFVAIFEMVCRIKPPKRERMYIQNNRLLRAFINNKIDLSDRNETGETFLMLACENRRIDIVRSLLKYASYRLADGIDAVDKSGETAQMKAEKNNDSEIVMALSGFRLISAVRDGKEDIVKSMIAVVFNASNIFVKSWDSESNRFDMRRDKKNKFDIWKDALYITMGKVSEHSEAISKLLLDCDILSSVEAEIGHTLLHRIIRYSSRVNKNELRLIEILLKSGKINVNATDGDGCTALHLAKDETLASLLIRYGADVNTKDNKGNTPLMEGIFRGYKVSILRTILNKTATWVDIDAMDCNGRTALMIGAMQKNSDVVELLLNAGASVNLADHLGFTALHHALYGNIAEYDEFPRNSEELKKRKEIKTILFDAEKPQGRFNWLRKIKQLNDRRMKIVELLLRRSDVDVNALTFEHFSPLDIAEGCIPQIPPSIGNVVKEKGASLNVFKLAKSQSTSDFHLDVRCRFSLQRIVCEVISKNDQDFLKERLLTLIQTFKEQIVSGKDRQGRTALHLAAISLSFISPANQSTRDLFRENCRTVLANEIVHKLISLGCNVNEVDIYGRSAMHYADEVLQALFTSTEADPIAKDKDGISMIDSTSRRVLDIVRALYNQNEETLFLRLMNNRKLEINVQYCDSQDGRRPKELNLEKVPYLLWEDGEYAFRHPLVEQITKEVMDLMNVIAKEIERLDPRFEVRPEFVGSSNEGTKLRKPDQFDFCFVLTKIGQLCEVSQSPEHPTGFVHIKQKQTKGETKENDFDNLFEEDGILNTVKLDWQFRTTLMNAVVYIESRQSFDFNFEFQKPRINSHSSALANSWDAIQKVSNIKMLRPRNFSSVNIISINIVPCIHVDGWWPDEAISNVSEDIMKFGCNLVFDIPQHQYPWVPYSDSCAKISFAKAESDTVKNIFHEAKEAYMIGKTMIEKSQWNSIGPFNHILKNCLLYCIEALTPTSEKASKLGLSLEELEAKFHQMDRQVWLKCLMKCHLDFVAQDFCPCYYMPQFSLPIGKEYAQQQGEYLKRFSWSWMTDDSDKFPNLCRKAYAFYCCTSNDISESCCQLPAPDPLWERFDRDQLIASLYEIAYK